MSSKPTHVRAVRVACALLLGTLPAAAALAEETPNPDQLETITVTGSRIIQSGAQNQQPISIIDRAQIDKSGLGSVGELLQQLTTGGKAHSVHEYINIAPLARGVEQLVRLVSQAWD